MKKKLLYIAFILYVALMLWLLFIQRLVFKGYAVNEIYLVPFTTISHFVCAVITYSDSFYVAVKNLLGNIFLFVPLGLFLPSLFKKFDKLWKVTVFTALLMCVLEPLQYITGLGVCDVDDVILNTLGAVIGYLIYKSIKKTAH